MEADELKLIEQDQLCWVYLRSTRLAAFENEEKVDIIVERKGCLDSTITGALPPGGHTQWHATRRCEGALCGRGVARGEVPRGCRVVGRGRSSLPRGLRGPHSRPARARADARAAQSTSRPPTTLRRRARTTSRCR
jgi:hypothetical protein